MIAGWKSSWNVNIVLVFSLLFIVLAVINNTANRKGEDYLIQNFKVFDSADSLDGLDTSKYQLINEEHVDLGFVSDEVWVGFEVDEQLIPVDVFHLEVENPFFRKLDLYRVTADGEIVLYEEAGTTREGSGRFFNYPNPVFSIKKGEGFSDRFLININAVERIRFSVIISDDLHLFNKYSDALLLVSLYGGIMLALFLYNLILYFSVRDKVYIFYCFYILFISMAQLSLMGYSLYYFLGNKVYLFEISIIGFSALAGIFGIFFVKYFLHTKHYVPQIDKLLTFTSAIYILAFASRLLSFIEFSYLLTDIAGILVPLTFISAGFAAWRKGHKSAMYFLIAWAVFLAGLIIYVLQNYGMVQLEPLSNLPMLLGSALEAILLSLALASRINILKQEKETEQREKLEALKENERLIKEQNTYLEKMVHIRTEELELTLKNLQNTQTQLVNQEKMASLGQLTAGIAHEINNPINFVSSNISPLKRDLKDILEIIEIYREKGAMEFSPESKAEIADLEEELELTYLLGEVEQLLNGIEDGAKRTVEIVRGLRLFSRVDEQDVKRVNLHDGLDSTLILLNSSLQGRITVTKEYGELPLVECLAGKINQVFMNIINNAIHALLDPSHHNDNPEIIIRTTHCGENVKIEIIDNGPGMPSHVKEKAFEPFFTTKEVGQGTGLGLSIVYTVVQNHKGKLEIISNVNEGTNFVIILPVNQKVTQNEG